MSELLGGRVPRRRLLRWSAALVGAGAVGVGAVFGSRLGTDPTLVGSPLIGRPAPAVTLPLLEGTGQVSLVALRGRVVVVNFWASWCVACRGEHPALVGAARQYGDSGVTFVGVDYQDSASAAVAFFDELGRGGGDYRYVTDPGSRAALEFGLFGVPETFVIDRSGTVAAKITGGATYPLLAGVLDAVLAGRAPASVRSGPVQPGAGAPLRGGR
ncbi:MULTISPECIES: TlpA disulfide reductase family protein [unclassified Pseudonocardia]|uniref:TlpA family protein disulfide reductase n=1 Tax=unclassified Pseudonocardia TaxID=2619320 RepID=UPI000959790F|nr:MULTISPECIES: TlpA disulfide reductase family protein [unclassified Pseudonocardia]MBN9098026.1 TlpA family protein disulfide reductase [Pseudonocardia sp.]OJY54424.1 MAG: redoxin [Pseudonocardia sp. 73-21]